MPAIEQVDMNRGESISVESLLEQTGNRQAQLPIDELRIIDSVPLLNLDGGRYGKGEIVTEMPIDSEAWFFKCHFPGDPIMPGCFGLEGLWQSLGLLLFFHGVDGKVRALGVGELKLSGEVLPTANVLQFHLHVRKLMKRNCSIALADGEVRVDGKLIYEAKDVKVGIFPELTATSNGDCK
jgi:3-hydroxyacyl-[acyl-carrier protein] dehydratase/trans-2-decenoyl-[acyl-carrier protein] isomerase